MRNSILSASFVLFLLVRVFVTSPDCFISMDEAKYLALARVFPYHTLFNNQLYLVHPPLFPYLIRAFSLAIPDYIAGMTVSLIFAVLTFVVMVRLYRLFGQGRYWITIALFVLAASPLHIAASRVVYKDSMFLGLFTLSLYLFIRGVIQPSGRHLYGAGLVGAVGCLTSDLALSLLPCFAAGYIIFRHPKLRIGTVIRSVAVLPVAYGCWLLVRIIVFKNHIFYPVGVDGTIEYVRDFTLRQLFTPRYFPATATIFNFSLDLSEFRINANVFPLTFLPLPGFAYPVFYLFITLTAIYTAIRAMVKRHLRGSPDLFFAVLLVIFALPAVLHPEPRFLFPILLPMSYFFARGLCLMTEFFPRPVTTKKKMAWITVAVLLIVTAAYLNGSRHLVFLNRKEVEVSRTAHFLERLPDGGVMAQVGYPPELAYLTGRRVLALPITPRVLDDFIRRYAISYLLYGQHYLAPIHTDDPSLIWCYHTIKYIRAHPEKYPLLRVVDEVYRSGAPPDRIFIHEVRRD